MDLSDYAPATNLLEGRVVLVTGSSRGIGRTAALAFASHGATVVLHGRDVDALENAYDEIEHAGHAQPAAIPLDFDKATTRDYDGLAHAIESQLGRLDGILHSAGFVEKLSPLEQQSAEEWNRILRVNLVAPFALTQACSRLLRNSTDASVVFTSESHGHVPAAFWGGYAVAKSGVEALMKIQAAEWHDMPNLRANAIVPGPVASPSRAKTHPGELASSQRPPAALMPAYLYLIGPDSRGITGTVVHC
ncbi:MAG TPA: SDR family NAD(P)-dependent oxidoreductase [Burkholderiales bacterium]|nr:SDR family NAD(P)-dependent oxidoreductase [Burkholderiales bacterium]